ncbi:OBAP family protein [Crenalkalicoccus roseus]|uniref:OBAP family protein n=1 Tax=Crenalkalicoccus roseus TaxID=1485588 RepID=UPI001F0262B1|nr:OBAP family protein [Crenalkalicoccus roseus]
MRTRRNSCPARVAPAMLGALLLGACTGAGETGQTVRPAGETAPAVRPEGSPKRLSTRALEAGARVLQRTPPPQTLDIYIVGFHPMRHDPTHQMEAHHFCRQVNEDFAQCALYDGNTPDANLTGIEFIISERLFQQLPPAERRYWHPHNGEILSGQLVAPGLTDAADAELMRSKLNSYGKTWHVWSTDRGDRLPFGEPMLAWSFNRDGEARPGLVEDRDRRMGISTEDRRRARQHFLNAARPQEGVDALRGAFPWPTTPIPGVVDSGAVR